LKRDACTDRVCYQAKTEAHIAGKIKKAEKKGEALTPVSSLYRPENKDLLAADQYRRIGDKETPCPSAKSAIIVEGDESGDTVVICSDPKCPIHRPKKPAGGYTDNYAKEEKKNEQKAKTETDFRKKLLEKVLAAVPFNLLREDWEIVIRALAQQSNAAKIICERFKWKAPKNEFEHPEYRLALRDNIASIPSGKLFPLIIELCVLRELEVSYWNITEPELLLDVAKRYKIDVEALRDQPKAAKPKKPKSSPKPAKSETKPSKKETKAPKSAKKKAKR
jgi:ParB family transcriptional regulator, chromosome partitioning protein